MTKGQVTFADNPIKKDIGMNLIMPAVYQKKRPKSRLFFRPIYSVVIATEFGRKISRGISFAIEGLCLCRSGAWFRLLFRRSHFHLQ